MDGQKQQLNGVVQNGKYLTDYQSLVNHVAEVHIGHGAINIMKRKQGTNGAFAPPPQPNGGGFPSNMRFGIGTPSAEQFEKFLEDRQKSDRARMEEKRIWRLEHAYRTELCRFLQREGYCPFGKECRFAHDEHELRLRREHPKYKTTLCRNFTTNGYCLYGVRCQFIHQSPPERDETQQPPKLISRPPFAFSAIEAQPNGTTGMKLGPKSVYAHSFSGFSGANGFASSSATPGVVQNGQHKPSGSRSDTVWPNNDVWSNYASGLWN